jgi:hypothetical protein
MRHTVASTGSTGFSPMVVTTSTVARQSGLSVAVARQQRSVDHTAGPTTAARVSRPFAGDTLAAWTLRWP